MYLLVYEGFQLCILDLFILTLDRLASSQVFLSFSLALCHLRRLLHILLFNVKLLVRSDFVCDNCKR